MAYRIGNREQATLFPPSIEDYVGKTDPVRAYDAFVEAIDLSELGFSISPDKVGNSSYAPKSMLKLIIYGCSYGIRSSRKLERATHHNLSFIWLVNGLKPNFKTISEFRRNNKKPIAAVLKKCAHMCVEFDLIDGNCLFVDGTKIRANAGIKNTWTEEKCEKSLAKLDKRIEEILKECEDADKSEGESSSFVSMKEELEDKRVLKAKVEEIVKKLDQKGKKSSLNTTDEDCAKVKGRQGTHAGYNSQSVVDGKNGIIVHTEVVNDNNDLNQFSSQINQANKVLENKCKVAVADAGYDNVDDLKKIDDQGIKVVVPQQKHASGKPDKVFDKENFEYDAENDRYICPEGNSLDFRTINEVKRSKVYKITDKSLCLNCVHFDQCAGNKEGRSVTRLLNEETRQKLKAQYEEPDSKAAAKLRGQKVEHPFGHIKGNLGANAFLLRGREGVNAEMSVFATCFNIARMITIFGVSGLVEKLLG
jgi:transposase